MSYFNTHAGRAVLAITGAALILAVPVTLPWIVAVVILQYGVKQLRLAFREMDYDILTAQDSDTPLSVPADGQRGIDGRSRDLVVTRSSLQ
jgi:hypothetical protein